MLIRSVPAAVLALALAGPALAATPNSGTIDDTTHQLEWSGGPFVMANVTNLLGDPVCLDEEFTCDVYYLDVNLSNADIDDDLILVEITPDLVHDFDLYIYDAETGRLVGSSGNDPGEKEQVMLGAENRKYRIVVLPWATAAGTYTGTVTYIPAEHDKSRSFFGGAIGGGLLVLLAMAGVAGLRRRH
jgi:hypothetical protein